MGRTGRLGMCWHGVRRRRNGESGEYARNSRSADAARRLAATPVPGEGAHAPGGVDQIIASSPISRRYMDSRRGASSNGRTGKHRPVELNNVSATSLAYSKSRIPGQEINRRCARRPVPPPACRLPDEADCRRLLRRIRRYSRIYMCAPNMAYR